MSISFYVKNKKKFLGYEKVLNVEEALTILDKELNTYNTGNIDINGDFMGRAYEVRKASIQKTGAARGKIYSMYAREIYDGVHNCFT